MPSPYFKTKKLSKKYASHFNNPKRKLQICTNVFQKELRLSNVIISFFPLPSKNRLVRSKVAD